MSLYLPEGLRVHSPESEEITRIASTLGMAALYGTDPLRNADGSPLDLTLICNDYGDPLAVHLRSFYNTHESSWQQITAPAHDLEMLRDVFPMVGTRLLPPNVQRLVDLVVQASMDRTDILASQITSQREDRAGKDTYRHFDHPDPMFEKHNALYGLNIHMTTRGSADVELGRFAAKKDLIKYDRLYLEELDADDHNLLHIASERRGQREAMVRPFARAVLHPGDVLIFRGGFDRHRGLLPSAHLFTTHSGSEPRLYERFAPSYSDARDISPTRQRFRRQYGLAA